MVVPCPSREQYQRLLNDQLDAAEEQCLEEHVKSCADCLRRLDELTAISPESPWTTGPGSLASPSQSRGNPPAEAALDGPRLARQFLERLHREGLTESPPWRARAGQS